MDEHLVNLDRLQWVEAEMETAEELRASIHKHSLLGRICHIYKGDVYCFCRINNDGADDE